MLGFRPALRPTLPSATAAVRRKPELQRRRGDSARLRLPPNAAFTDLAKLDQFWLLLVIGSCPLLCAMAQAVVCAYSAHVHFSQFNVPFESLMRHGCHTPIARLETIRVDFL